MATTASLPHAAVWAIADAAATAWNADATAGYRAQLAAAFYAAAAARRLTPEQLYQSVCAADFLDCAAVADAVLALDGGAK